MGTRATYEFEDKNTIMKSITFYAHFDGYPDGAAERFANMIEALYLEPEEYSFILSEKRGGLAHAFLRGNSDAEITHDKLFHGDTEWHYKVYRNEQNIYMVDAFEITRHWGEDKDNEFTKTISIPLVNFINMGKFSKDQVVRLDIENDFSKKEYLLHKNQLEYFREKGYESLTKFQESNPNYKIVKSFIEAVEKKINQEPEIPLSSSDDEDLSAKP